MNISVGEIIFLILHTLKWQVLYSSLLLLALLPLIKLLNKRHPLLVHTLCILVLLRLILPPDISSPLSARALFDFLLADNHRLLPTLLMDDTTTTFLHLATNVQPESNPALSLPEKIIFVLWLTGMIFFAVRFLISRRYYHRLLKKASTLKQTELIRASARWRAVYGIKRSVRLLTSKHGRFLFTAGIFRPVIYIPQVILENSKTEHLEIAIAHEMAHIRRYDDLWIIIQQLIQCVYFFHPLIWYCNAKIHSARERVCDQWVLTHSISPQTYCNSILSMLKQQLPNSHHDYYATFGTCRQKQMLERFSFIIQERNAMKKPQIKIIVTSTLLLGILLLPMAPVLSTEKVNLTAMLLNPTQSGWISSDYGFRSWPAGEDKGKRRFHQGIDIAAKLNTPVYAIADGIVAKVINKNSADAETAYGNYLIIEHADGMRSLYAHLQSIAVKEGESLQAATVIGTVGNSGISFGSHLHFELYKDGEHVDPNSYIAFELPHQKPQH